MFTSSCRDAACRVSKYRPRIDGAGPVSTKFLYAIALLALAASTGAATIQPGDSSPLVALAAKETRRYVYLRTGTLLPIDATPAAGPGGSIRLGVDDTLGPEEYRLRSEGSGGSKGLRIAGGSAQGVLYGAYAFAEKLGVRFYVHGDVVPDERIPFAIPDLDETGRPLFATRGIQPFHDFAEGPDWWSQDDYLAYVAQLAKMRMNFIGLHCYPQSPNNPFAEPLIWHGLPEDLADDGTVRFSYPAAWFTTDLPGNVWRYAAGKTSGFSGGAAGLFPSDAYGPDVMGESMTLPKSVEEANQLFDRVGRMMGTVVKGAHDVGVKVCVGTETPLVLPKALREHLAKAGRNPDDPAVVREVYRGTFQWVQKNVAPDYYWLWTPEGWTWGGNNPQQFQATTRDIQAALDMLQALGNPFTLATSGWVLGPQHDRAALDAFLPKESPMACINQKVGHAPVEYAFANVQGRPKWAIPWMENDPNMVGCQLWAARMRYDAVDARRVGCTGLLGIHWRTKALAPNVSALADAAWDQSWVPANHDVAPVKPFGRGPGGQTVSFPAQMAGASEAEQPVYRTVRFDTDGYTLEIPNGTYEVTLKFCEPHYDAPGKRVFGVKVQEQMLAERLDLFATVGKNRAHDLTAKGAKVTDGKLKIAFPRVVEFPLIAGIVIDGQTDAINQLAAAPLTRRINCGGAACPGYEADVAGGGGNPAPESRAMPIADFYEDFARAHFGAEVAQEAGAIMASLDGMGFRPNPSDWHSGPGDLNTGAGFRPHARAKGEVVARFAALRGKIAGAGDRERFDYWHHTFAASVAMYEWAAARADLGDAVNRMNAEQDAARKKELTQAALERRVALARVWDKIMRHMIGTVSTPGELGTIANLELRSRTHQKYLTWADPALEAALGAALPAACSPSMAYDGPARIIVPTVRGSVNRGEALNLRIIALTREPIRQLRAFVRPLGTDSWQAVQPTHVARTVWQARLPAAAGDFEYRVEMQAADGTALSWPATAPTMNQTVVVMP